MKRICIKKTSNVLDFLSNDGFSLNLEYSSAFQDLERYAEKENVDVRLEGEIAIFWGCCQRTFKVPAKCTKSIDSLVDWVCKKIDFVNK